MSGIRAITFDAAQTLVRVDWNPRAFALKCAAAVGIHLDEGPAGEVYERMLGSRWIDYQNINRTRDLAQCEGFWRDLTSDWLERIGVGTDRLEPLLTHAEIEMYGSESSVFGLFDDTLPGLEALRSRGYALAVISNWDFTLHRVLKMLGLTEFFKVVAASFEEGVEKPDPLLFEIVLKRMGIEAHETLHVGDDAYDDVYGAHCAGLRSLLIDRSQKVLAPGTISSLLQVQEAIDTLV